MTAKLRVLVYAPFSFNGRGVAESCSSILARWPGGSAAQIDVYAARFRKQIPGSATGHESLPFFERHVPWRLVQASALARLNRDFATALKAAEPSSTIAYYWPDPPVELVELAASRGITTVREMINTACATSGPILDAAYARLGLPAAHSVTTEKIAEESRELLTYDFYYASNPLVERSLLQLGAKASQILVTTFGWNPERFGASSGSESGPGVRMLFVGTLNVRKGVPELLQAWVAADVPGELVLAGTISSEVAEMVKGAVETGSVRTLGFVKDVGRLFHTADVFVFPTHEEGGPQVTYEAAGCGLPVITTPMGAARLVEPGRSGVVIAAGSVEQLTEAIGLLGSRPDLRERYGAEARQRSQSFAYQEVARRRWDLLLKAHRGTNG